MNKSWDKPYNCHIDLNWEDAAGQGINGPGINITSAAGKVATTYSLQSTASSLSPNSAPTPTASFNVSPNATPNASQVASAASPTSPSTTPSTAADNANNANASNTQSQSSSGLSTGAKAGIAIGAIAGALAILGLGFLVWRRRRNANKDQEGGFGADGYAKPQGVAVMASDSTLNTHHDQGYAPPYQHADAMRHEAPEKTTYAMELASPTETHELPGSTTGPVEDKPVEKQ
jgi:LPXTG-motif cell wall-anchored protein